MTGTISREQGADLYTRLDEWFRFNAVKLRCTYPYLEEKPDSRVQTELCLTCPSQNRSLGRLAGLHRGDPHPTPTPATANLSG